MRQAGTTDEEDWRARNAGADERIFGLVAIAEDQQAAVRAALEGLAIERAELAKDRVTLVQAGERMQKLSEELAKVVLRAVPQMLEASGKGATQAVNTALAGVGKETINVVATAAQPAFDSIAESVESAATVQRQLEYAVRDFGRKWTWVVACAVAGAILATALVCYGAVWWQLRQIEQLTVQRDKLAAEVESLQGQADQARRSGARRPGK